MHKHKKFWTETLEIGPISRSGNTGRMRRRLEATAQIGNRRHRIMLAARQATSMNDAVLI